jgi:hypothetical protein
MCGFSRTPCWPRTKDLIYKYKSTKSEGKFHPEARKILPEGERVGGKGSLSIQIVLGVVGHKSLHNGLNKQNVDLKSKVWKVGGNSQRGSWWTRTNRLTLFCSKHNYLLFTHPPSLSLSHTHTHKYILPHNVSVCLSVCKFLQLFSFGTLLFIFLHRFSENSPISVAR